MKVLLINPPSWIHSKVRMDMNPNLGLLYLAAVLEKAGYEVKVVDAECLRYTWKALRRKLKNEMPDIVGITCTTFSYMPLKETVKIAREILPYSKIFIGGPHVTALVRESLLENPAADIAVMGEGEQTLVELIKAIEENGPINRVNGIAFRSGDEILFTPRRTPIKDLDAIPFPARHLLEPNMTLYRGNEPLFSKPETVMIWSRGCPHRCLFCSNPVFGHQQTRYRSPKNIVDEVEMLHDKYNIRSIFVYDDELVGMSQFQNGWLTQVCDEIISRGLDDIIYKCQGRCSQHIKFEVLKKMRKAGFFCIMWGVESGSQKVLNAIRKDITTENIVETFELAKRSGIRNMAFIIVGNVSETREDVKKTVSLLKRIGPDYVQVTAATPLPGSELWNIAVSKNWIKSNDFSRYFMSKPVSSTDWMSLEEIMKMKKLLELKGLRFNTRTGIIDTFKNLEGFKRLPRRTLRFMKIVLARVGLYK